MAPACLILTKALGIVKGTAHELKPKPFLSIIVGTTVQAQLVPLDFTYSTPVLWTSDPQPLQSLCNRQQHVHVCCLEVAVCKPELYALVVPLSRDLTAFAPVCLKFVRWDLSRLYSGAGGWGHSHCSRVNNNEAAGCGSRKEAEYNLSGVSLVNCQVLILCVQLHFSLSGEWQSLSTKWFHKSKTG
ncbi:hypothetical protein B0H13DRAFT_1869534 [Mycena leptocephala]|nr:hypothetical protein B0H13DRAFT_1869534 [Mycena leptocephala]